MDSGKPRHRPEAGEMGGDLGKDLVCLGSYPATHACAHTHTHTRTWSEGGGIGPTLGKPQSERELIPPWRGPLNAPAGTGSLATAYLITTAICPTSGGPHGASIPPDQAGQPPPQVAQGLSPGMCGLPAWVPWAMAGGVGEGPHRHHPQHHTAARVLLFIPTPALSTC